MTTQPIAAEPVRLARAAEAAIIRHALHAAPLECCGLLVGMPGSIDEAVPARNVYESPTRFLVHPEDHFEVIRAARQRGAHVVGAYHSHPATSPVPSPRDLSECKDPHFLHLIVSLRAGAAVPELRAYRLNGANFEAVEFVTVGDRAHASAGRANVNDAELVSQVLAGSQEAARRLVVQHQQAVFNLVCRMVRDPGIAEELAQDAFVKAFAALRSFDPSYRFSSWILRIAQNTAIDHLRRPRPDSVSLDDEDGRDLGPLMVDHRAMSPLVEAERVDLAKALDQALDRLRPEYRRLVVLRYQEDQLYEEIAEMLDLPLGTVKSHLHRARQQLAGLMTDAGWGPSPGQERPEAATRRRSAS